MADKSIRIDDWACNLLFIGPYDSPEVDEVLDANRCEACPDLEDNSDCDHCNGTGYKGDFEVSWVDESNNNYGNVYEYINY
ncbi:hypothetical protein [Flavobacterium alkalisoli]|uniref:hypothetical protein n=1 Tax=Flavobacterium alkalisoli TaxID=2602769 RepID=UPI003A94F4F5